MSPLRMRMLEDMKLAGLAEGTQQVYVTAVHQLAAHYRRSPDRLGEEEVRRYLLGLRERGVARGGGGAAVLVEGRGSGAGGGERAAGGRGLAAADRGSGGRRGAEISGGGAEDRWVWGWGGGLRGGV